MTDHCAHNTAMAIAWRTLDLVKTLLREEEHRDYIEEAYLVVQQELERYEKEKILQDGGSNVAGMNPAVG